MSTAAQIITFAQNHLGFDSDTVDIPGLQKSQLLEILNQAVLSYHNAFTENGGEPSSILQAETGYTLVSNTDLDGAITSASTTINLTDASNFGSSGAIAVFDNNDIDFVEFTGKSSNQLTGVTGVNYSHEDEDAVALLYALPSNFESFRSTHDNKEGVKVDGTAYRYTTGVPRAFEFAIYDNGTTKYLVFPQSVTGDCHVYYNKSTTTIDETTDTVDIPVQDQWYAVWALVSAAAFDLGEDASKSQYADSQMDLIINKAMKRKNIGKRPRLGRSIHSNNIYYYRQSITT